LRPTRFARFAGIALLYTIGVILWGAWVRITGSGAGCGEHWPTCHGTVLPQDASRETLIELTHRATSGVTLILTVVLFVWARRAFASGSPVRLAAAITLAFVVAEAALGAGLVLFGLVADNDSVARAVVVALHLCNTFGLLAFGALAAWWAAGGSVPRWSGRGPHNWILAGAILSLILVGMTGAITALGDTLFPVAPTEGAGLFARVREDLSAGQHFLVQLRVIHPVLAVGVGLILVGVTTWLRGSDDRPRVHALAAATSGVVVLELGAGVLNITLGAPGWLQLVHLALADVLWISTVILAAETLADPARSQASLASARAQSPQTPGARPRRTERA
jgi:heme A synthase